MLSDSTNPRQRRINPVATLIVWCMFALLAAGVLVGTTELGLRIRRNLIATRLPAPPNEDSRFLADGELRIVNRPSYTYTSGSRSGAVLHYTNNALGLRGKETTREKPTGVRRVVMVGGSTVYGALADDDETIAVQLEMILRQQFGPNVEVLNAGVPGYDSMREAASTELNVLSFDPAWWSSWTA